MLWRLLSGGCQERRSATGSWCREMFSRFTLYIYYYGVLVCQEVDGAIYLKSSLTVSMKLLLVEILASSSTLQVTICHYSM